MSDWLYVANWWKYQHYNKRTPPWIKLHRSFFSDPAICSLSETNQLNLIKLWFVASEIEGRFSGDPRYIRARLGLYHVQSAIDLLALLESKELISKEDVRGHRRRSSIPETETETETETERTNTKASDEKTRPPLQYAFEDSNLKITVNQEAKFSDAFPWVKTQDEFAKMSAWLEVNKDKRPKNHGRFAHNWLARIPNPNGGSDNEKKQAAIRERAKQWALIRERSS